MEAMSPQQETVGGQPGRSSSLTGVSRIAGDPDTQKKVKTLAERRKSAPSLILDKTLQKQPGTKFLLIDGRVELKRGLQRQERHLFLFNDLFVVAKVKCNNNFKMKNKVTLSDMWTASCVDEVGEGNTNAMKSFVLGWPTVNFVVTFRSAEQKDKWLSLLQRYINLEKEKDYPKSIPLKIFAKDIGNCAYSKTITITNSDTANDVISMSLRMLGITGSERDYQLWVNSGKEETPYPLIGHEYPYGIKVSHLRDTALLMQLSQEPASPSSLQEPFLMEQVPREMQCQFILKHGRLAAAPLLSHLDQKTRKRRRSIINWPFCLYSSTHPENDVPIMPVSPLPGQLFGVALLSVCDNDNLPKPLLDMLSTLNQKGALTNGIFRISGNVKACRELKDKLNSGADVHLENEQISVIASVLKDFLRNIPGSILSSDLYDQWICVMDQESDDEKINTVQRLVDQLPRANILLLRYLFGLLHNIEQHSSSNQMTAYNLAVCIAPSLLCPATSSPERENEFTKKVSLLIQFLIENCCRVFGEEISSLFGEVSGTCDIKEKTSDVSCLQMSNSSYDTSEKELNKDTDAPCSDVVKKLSVDSRSLDWVLTLSIDNLHQPEVAGVTLSDLDLDGSKHDEIQTDPPPECTPGTSTELCSQGALQEGTGAPGDRSTPPSLSTPVANVPKRSRRHRHFSEPSTSCLDSKLSYLRAFYQRKLRKSSCDVILPQKDGGAYLVQTEPQQEGGKVQGLQSLVTVTDDQKNAPTKNVRKQSWSGSEGSRVKLSPTSKPVVISVVPGSPMCSADTAGSSPPPKATAKGSRRQRCISEPSSTDQRSPLSCLKGLFSKKPPKASSDAGHLNGEQDYLERHKSLQVEGQKLFSQSLVLGIEVGKSSAASCTTEKCVPSMLDIRPRTSCSSLSSPDTSPSGSSVSSQDSAFSQIPEHSVFTPTDTASAVDRTLEAPIQQEDLSSDSCSSTLVAEMPGPSSGLAGSPLAYTEKGPGKMHSVTLHPSTWLRNGLANLRNWSLKNKTRASKPEEKRAGSLKRPIEPPAQVSGVPEASSLQEKQDDLPLGAAEGLGAVRIAQWCSAYPSQEAEKPCDSPLSLVEEGLELCMEAHEEGEQSGQHSPATLSRTRSSLSSLRVDDVSSPDPGSAIVCDVEDKYSIKDIPPQ